MEDYYNFELVLSGLEKALISNPISDSGYDEWDDIVMIVGRTLNDADCCESSLHIHNDEIFIDCTIKSDSWTNAVNIVTKAVKGCGLGIKVIDIKLKFIQKGLF